LEEKFEFDKKKIKAYYESDCFACDNINKGCEDWVEYYNKKCSDFRPEALNDDELLEKHREKILRWTTEVLGIEFDFDVSTQDLKLLMYVMWKKC